MISLLMLCEQDHFCRDLSDVTCKAMCNGKFSLLYITIRYPGADTGFQKGGVRVTVNY